MRAKQSEHWRGPSFPAARRTVTQAWRPILLATADPTKIGIPKRVRRGGRARELSDRGKAYDYRHANFRRGSRNLLAPSQK